MALEKEEILRLSNKACENTLMETLDIKFIDCGEDFMVAQMPVNMRVVQPDGVLHGGATVALAESVGSVASVVLQNNKDVTVRGIEITANHLKSVRKGMVYARAHFIHKGRTTQLIEIRVTDENDSLISICKLTTISLPQK